MDPEISISVHIIGPDDLEFDVDVLLSETVLQLKVRISGQSGLEPSQQIIIYHVHELRDGDLLQAYNIQNSETVHLRKKEFTVTDALVIAATGTVMLAPMVLAGPALALVGFTAAGPAAGSAAALWMSSIGAVQAGSTYAILQSAAMGGYGVPIVAGAVQTTAAGIGAVYSWFRKS